jgi:hypothetical protein
MKNTFKILVVIISMVITNAVNAQYSINKNKLSDVQQLEKVDFFETKQLSDKQIKQYKRQELIESTQERYQKENLFLAKLISENWNSSDKPKEISNSELTTKLKNKEGVWYITLRKHSDSFFDRRVVRKNYYYSYSHYQLSLYNDKKEVLRIPLVDEELSELNAEFAIEQIQNFISQSKQYKNQRLYAKEINASAGALSNKTLLIPEKLTTYSEEYLNTLYKGKIKIVPEEEIIKAVKAQDKTKAYLLITINDFSDEPSFNHLIIDCETNKPSLIYRNSSAYSKLCKHSCIVHRHNDKLEYLFGFHFKKYKKIMDS